MKIFTLNADAAYGNFSVLYKMSDIYGPGTETQLVYLEAKDLYTGVLTVSDQIIPYVNADLIGRAVISLLQRNGNLFPVVKQAIRNTITFPIPLNLLNVFDAVNMHIGYHEHYITASFDIKLLDGPL